MADTILDATGLKCPLPVLKAKRAMRALADGETLSVLASDPGAPADFVHFCAVTGYTLLGTEEAGGVFTIKIRKKPANS